MDILTRRAVKEEIGDRLERIAVALEALVSLERVQLRVCGNYLPLDKHAGMVTRCTRLQGHDGVCNVVPW